MTSRIERRLKKTKLERALIFGMVIIALLGIFAFIWGNSMGRNGQIVGLMESSAKRVNILVLGVDEREGDVGRSDTMFVVSLEQKTQDVDVISIPRDTRVKIPGYGYDKINHAYAEGKYKLAQRATEQLLGISVDHYVVVDFKGFKRIIDVLGGITIDVEKRMYYEDPYDDLVINLHPGVQKLNGEDAIAYVRYRDAEGDIGRIARQQKFLKALMRQVVQPATLTRLPALVRELSGALHTDISNSDIIAWGKLVNDSRKQGIQGYMIPGTPAYIGEVNYWLPNIVETRKMLAEIMGVKLDDKALAMVRTLAAEYERSIPQEMNVMTDQTVDIATEKAKSEKQNADNTLADKSAETGKKLNSGMLKPGATQKNLPVPKDGTVAKRAKTRAEIINASGNDEAGVKMANEMRRQGFEVVAVRNSRNIARITTVVDHTDNEAVFKQVNSLPFDYDLSVLQDGVKNAEVTVIIGTNYN